MDIQHIRSFIAIELSEELKSGLLLLQTKLRSAGYTFVKWVSPEGIHLTLKFLGDIPSNKVAEITRAIEEASVEVAFFNLETNELGAFPNLRSPNVFWLNVNGDLDILATLQKRIDDALEPMGFASEKRAFTPHLTLARIRESATLQNRRDFGELIAKTRFDIKHKIEVHNISLMRSQLLPTGAVYGRLAEIRFKSSK